MADIIICLLVVLGKKAPGSSTQTSFKRSQLGLGTWFMWYSTSLQAQSPESSASTVRKKKENKPFFPSGNAWEYGSPEKTVPL
jgi:hypothetical protein